MKLRTILVFLTYICALALHAVPAKHSRYVLTLPDGSTVEATAMGDEHLHFFLADDGRCLLLDSIGIARYVEQDTIRARWQARAAKRQAARDRRMQARRARQAGQPGAMTGSRRGLVILVEFPDVPFHHDNDVFRRLFNEEGFDEGVNVGSVHDYFHDVSYGVFDFSFDVVGPVTVSQPLEYYGANDSEGYDLHPATMAAEAIRLTDEAVDFSRYDWDGDGEVEQIFIIHSGFDEAQTNRFAEIWSHAWTLSEAMDEGDGNGPVTVDGVLVDSYATSAELLDKSGTAICGIGTACHEFSHCFGLPDTYDTIGRTFGLHSWDIMDYGEYNGDGGTPAGFTSYERMFCGWVEPTELIDAIEVRDMPALTSAPVAYILRNSGKEDEYYLLENRQKEGWDRFVGGHGMLVLHVDYDVQAWKENTVNTISSHPRMTVIPADNIRSSFSLAGDPWPGTSGKTELSATSIPAAKLYNFNAEGTKTMNHTITGIDESDDGLISFIFDEMALGMEGPVSAPDIKVEGYYDLQGRQAEGRELQKGIYVTKGKKIMIQ